MAIFHLNYLNQVQIAANTSSRNRTKAIIQRFPKFQVGGLRENGGLLLFSPVRAHLLTTLKGSGISCGNRALCEADAAAAAASRQCHSTCGCCCHRLCRSQLFPLWKQSAPCPHKPATGSFACGYAPKLGFWAFSLLRKRNRKRKNEVKKIWRFIIWKRK